MRTDRRSLIAAMIRLARRPGLWLMVLLIAVTLLMPAAGPLMRCLFPGVPLAHAELVAISSLAAAVIGIGFGIFVTRESGREFAPMAGAIAPRGQTFPPVAVLALTIPVLATAPPRQSWRFVIMPFFQSSRRR